jgi:hypothetical protein
MFEIPAGGRRYRALELPMKQKRLAKTAPVPCVVRDPATDILGEDDSLAENIQRAPLHPLDQFRAFQALREKGRCEEDIAAAFFVGDGADELPDEVDERLGEIEALAAFDHRPVCYDPADIARAGVFVGIDAEGALSVDRGYVRPQEEAPLDEPELAGAGLAPPLVGNVGYLLQRLDRGYPRHVVLGIVGDGVEAVQVAGLERIAQRVAFGPVEGENVRLAEREAERT